MDREAEHAIALLEQAVAQIAALIRARPRVRDALVAARRPDLRSLATRVAGACGFRVFLADTSVEAAATALGRNFDLILAEADEHIAAAARSIRALPEPNGAAALIALGASANGRDELADAGVDGVVTPPVTAEKLVQLMVLLVAPAPSSVGAAELQPVQHDDRDDECGDGQNRRIEEQVQGRPQKARI